jgi:hypothetical protein
MHEISGLSRQLNGYKRLKSGSGGLLGMFIGLRLRSARRDFGYAQPAGASAALGPRGIYDAPSAVSGF